MRARSPLRHVAPVAAVSGLALAPMAGAPGPTAPLATWNGGQ